MKREGTAGTERTASTGGEGAEGLVEQVLTGFVKHPRQGQLPIPEIAINHYLSFLGSCGGERTEPLLGVWGSALAVRATKDSGLSNAGTVPSFRVTWFGGDLFNNSLGYGGE